MLSITFFRLFHYNRAQNTSKVLIDELYFVVAETGASQLQKYYLQGPKKGQHEIFVDGLPGSPDNLTPDEDGLWVPLVTSNDDAHPAIFQSFSRFPLIRKFILRLFHLFEAPFRFVNNAFPNAYTQKTLHFAGHFESTAPLLPKRTTILQNLLISASQDGTIKCFDLRAEKSVNTYFSNSESVRDVKFSPHSTNLFSAVSENGTVQLWDIRRYRIFYID